MVESEDRGEQSAGPDAEPAAAPERMEGRPNLAIPAHGEARSPGNPQAVRRRANCEPCGLEFEMGRKKKLNPLAIAVLLERGSRECSRGGNPEC